jgi:hypothetical protein
VNQHRNHRSHHDVSDNLDEKLMLVGDSNIATTIESSSSISVDFLSVAVVDAVVEDVRRCPAKRISDERGGSKLDEPF